MELTIFKEPQAEVIPQVTEEQRKALKNAYKKITKRREAIDAIKKDLEEKKKALILEIQRDGIRATSFDTSSIISNNDRTDEISKINAVLKLPYVADKEYRNILINEYLPALKPIAIELDYTHKKLIDSIAEEKKTHEQFVRNSNKQNIKYYDERLLYLNQMGCMKDLECYLSLEEDIKRYTADLKKFENAVIFKNCKWK